MSSIAHPEKSPVENSLPATPLVGHLGVKPLPKGVAALNDQQVLASAFEQFNAVSAQLADSYHEMEQRVGSLNQELHELADQRLAELKDKERVSQRLESLLNLMPAGVVVLDSKGVVVQCNPAALEFLGEPLEGQLWRDVIRRSFAPQRDDGHEISLKDGRRVNMVTRSFQGSDPGQLILLTDLTETRELQRRLDRHRRLSEMGRMMSSLAHQIRTPLSAAMLYAGHLCDSQLTQDQQQRFSEKVLSRLNHLDQQVKDMLIFVKGDVKLTDSIRVSELLHEFETALEVPINSSQSKYQITVDCPEIMLHCNRESMVGAMMNLANNAIQSVGKDVELLISVTCINRQSIEIVMSDNGPGISPQLMKNLQEPFFTTKSQGTGLGLSVVRAVVQAHHGEFTMQSQVGVGTRAILRLPVMDVGLDKATDNSNCVSNLGSIT
jgi:two-component system sensor histidine kinase FlrB